MAAGESNQMMCSLSFEGVPVLMQDVNTNTVSIVESRVCFIAVIVFGRFQIYE